MEQILNKLSEIEATANAIMQDAARQKQALSEEAEKQIKDFDASLETKTSAEIRKIWPARKTPGSPSFVQRQKTSYPGWIPTTKPTTRLFPKSCFRK